jgi:hypothetical protein
MTSQQGSENAIIDQIIISVSPTSSPENIHVYTHTHTLKNTYYWFYLVIYHLHLTTKEAAAQTLHIVTNSIFNFLSTTSRKNTNETSLYRG